MRGRPLCLVCLICILICGRYEVVTPTDSIFCSGKQEMEVTVSGQVYRITQTEQSQFIYLKDVIISYQNKLYSESKLFVYDNEFHTLKFGNQIQVVGTASSFYEARNTGNFDLRQYYARQGFFGAVHGETIRISKDTRYPIRQEIYEGKQAWSKCLDKNFSEKDSGIMKAILLGDKGWLSEDVKAQYQKGGISHILAISGLHITFIGFGLYKIMRKMSFGFFLSGTISLCFVACYVWMTGMSVSGMRAFLMLAIRIGAEITGRVCDMPTSMLLSGLLLVLYRPEVILDTAFLLSFGAVAGVVFIAPAIRCVLPKFTSVIKGVDVCIGVWLTLFPLTLLYYYEFPLYSIGVNILVVPVVSILLSCGMLGSVWNIFFVGCKWVLRYMEWIIEKVEQLPGAMLVWGKPPRFYLVLFYVCLITMAILVLLNQEEQKRIGKYLLFVFVGLLLWGQQLYPADQKVQVAFLDVGQGDCIFVKGPTGETYLVDGGSSDVKNVGENRIIPFLKSQGVKELDYVFVTHGDMDHYSGIGELLETNIQIRHLVFSSAYQKDEALAELYLAAQDNHIKVQYMEKGMQILEEDFSIACMGPEKDLDGKGNEASLILSLTYNGVDILLTGDTEGEGEEQLAKTLREQKKSYEILKVSHHGSAKSTSQEILKIIRPDVAVISAGKDNPYGHPSEETLGRLEQVGCDVYETSKCGEIRIVIDECGANLLTFF